MQNFEMLLRSYVQYLRIILAVIFYFSFYVHIKSNI